MCTRTFILQVLKNRKNQKFGKRTVQIKNLVVSIQSKVHFWILLTNRKPLKYSKRMFCTENIPARRGLAPHL